MKKEDLQEYLKLRVEIKILIDEIKSLDSDIKSPNSPIYSHMPKNKSTKTVADSIVRLCMMKERYEKRLDDLIKIRECIEDVIDGLSDPIERSVLRSRYILDFSWKKICDITTYEWAQVHRIHNRALEKLREV